VIGHKRRRHQKAGGPEFFQILLGDLHAIIEFA
jgi:hypothetical protein